ncbi:response regulator [Thermodesulfobacteriota bacterium]
MTKKVLLVDDDRILLRLLETKLKKYNNVFSILTAGNGLQAIEKLTDHSISLVVTDLQMPEMDGLALLAYLSESYPDIPVIILTAHSSPASKKTALKEGAAGYMEKPFVVEDLVKKIIEGLEKESEGGTLQTVTLDMFLQLVEMEEKTCTIRVVNQSSAQKGVLFFKNGELMDARIQDSKGLAAAYEIFSWDNVTLSLQDTCRLEKKQINVNLKTILMEAMRLKDEATKNGEPIVEKTAGRKVESDLKSQKPPESSPADSIRSKLEKMKWGRKWLKEIFQDDVWNDFISEAVGLGKVFEAGTLKSCYINRDGETDFILIPDQRPTVISVTPRCPRDKIIKILSE